MRYAILAAAVLLLAGCGGYGGGKSKSGGGKTTIAGVSANDHGTKSVSGGSAEVELDDYYFQPTVLKGKPGSLVTLKLKNEGSVEHNFTIDSQGVDKDLEPGKSAEVSVTIPKSGAIAFYCKYPKSMGMAGALSGGGSGGMTGGGSTSTQTSTGKGY